MANLPLIIGGAVLVALLVAVTFITDIVRQRSSAAQEALTDVARLEQRERALRAQVAALEEQLATRNAEFETQSTRNGEAIAALEQQLAQEKQAAADYRQTFDVQLADNDRLHADLARTVSEITGRWQTLRAAATGEMKNEAAGDSGAVAQAPAEPPAQKDAPVHDADVLDLEPEAAINALPAAPEHAEMAPAIS